eukprot:maker-scaffold_1-snap-gene-2.11-mRNA-1 protein AED:0.01 eAED:0.01 QI:337/1/1/1/1/1/2/102/255
MSRGGNSNYDKDVSTWSTEGRLFQVEYAMEALKHGSTSVGVLGKDTVVIAALKINAKKMSSSADKLFPIDDHMGMVVCGLKPDARNLASYMRTECLNYKYFYNAPMISSELMNDIAEKSQEKTQNSWSRPYGVGLIVAAVDKDGPHLYRTCPSGNLFNVKATAIGQRSEGPKTYLVSEDEKTPFLEMGREDLIIRALKALERSALREETESNQESSVPAGNKIKLKKESIVLAVVGRNEKFTVLSEDEIQGYLTA